jgi:hypothetical protein
LPIDVIGAAYERTSMIVTTNLPFEQWPEMLAARRQAATARRGGRSRRGVGGESTVTRPSASL